MIKKFENYTEDLINKDLIDSHSYLDNTFEVKGIKYRYEHVLVFVLPYHKNKIISSEKVYRGIYDVGETKLKFDEVEKAIGGLGGGLLRRSSVLPAYVYDGQFYKGNQGNSTRDWGKAMRENKPIYFLRYVTIKDGRKMYSEEGLNKAKEMYPEFLYKK